MKLTSNLELLVNKLIKEPKSNKSGIINEGISNSNIHESFADASGNLNNSRNPFINAQENLENSQSSSIMNEAKIKKRGKYKERAPIHYYYKINNYVYKYTCKNKDVKNVIPFKCSDTLCPANAIYNRLNEPFSIDDTTA